MSSKGRPGLHEILMVCASLIGLIGCSPVQSVPVTPTPTFPRFLSSTWTATITLSSSPTTIPTPTVSPTFTPTISHTLPPSLTPLPTISFDNALWKFEVLLATNGGCRLPCFWGMTPGRTTVAEMNQFTNRFPPDLVDIDGHRHTVYYITHKTGILLFQSIFSLMTISSNPLVSEVILRNTM